MFLQWKRTSYHFLIRRTLKVDHYHMVRTSIPARVGCSHLHRKKRTCKQIRSRIRYYKTRQWEWKFIDVDMENGKEKIGNTLFPFKQNKIILMLLWNYFRKKIFTACYNSNIWWRNKEFGTIHEKQSDYIVGKSIKKICFSCRALSWAVASHQMFTSDLKTHNCFYYYMRNFCNLIGLEQWYFSLIWNT